MIFVVILGIYLIPVFETTDTSSVENSSDWMKSIPDGTPLNMITIPGTHNSATAYIQPAFFSRCQSRSISEQLNDGFRYLDIRLGTETEEDRVVLKLVNGSSDCRKKSSFSSGRLLLDNVLAQCYAFLDLYPNETVIFSVTQEGNDISASSFENLLYSYVSENSDYWLLTDEIPSLGEARGKLVLMRHYQDVADFGACSGIPLYWEDQAGFDNPDLSFEKYFCEGITLWVQDRHEFDNTEKWLSFITTLATCPVDYGSGEICLNFLSTNGSMKYGHPFAHANKLNGEFSEISLNPGIPYGWIILDFGTPSLAEIIYSCNFISQEK